MEGDARQPGIARRLQILVPLREALARPFDRFRDSTLDPQPYVAGEVQLLRLMTWPALSGLAGSLLILWGASQPGSPFTLNSVSDSTLPIPSLIVNWKTWFFGTGAVPAHAPNVLIGVVGVYAGMFLMIRAWLALIHLTRLHPGIPLRAVWPVLVAWTVPLLIVAPLFSHDVYSYVAQGEEASRHINPYMYPPSVLGTGGNPFAGFVDGLWGNTTSPYGPVFVWIAGAVLRIVDHGELAALVSFRVLAVAGTALLAIFAPRLARSYGRDPGKVFVLVALNPLVLFHLVAGDHNDAIMIGLLVAGLSVSREKFRWAPAVGILLCTLAALVKIPALVGVLYIGWDWLGPGVSPRRRIGPAAVALAISGAIMTLVTWLVGFGWGWVAALQNPGAVSSWMDPATGFGDILAPLVSAVGFGDHKTGILVLCKLLAGLVGLAIAARLLWKADGVGSVRAMALTLFVAVVCSPVVQPWYFVWGVAVAAVVAERRLRSWLVGVSVVMSFLGLPGGQTFLHELRRADPFAVASAVVALLAVALVLFGPEIRAIRLERRQPLLAAAEEVT
ncbi:MAG: polyprenol phosphomannose-dependent alpha 1,6 mannosyltransferase MptB [Acidimicrobiales bacterium]